MPGFNHERWLGNGLAVHAHMPGLDESLRFVPRFDQSRSHEHHVKSVKMESRIDMLLGHISLPFGPPSTNGGIGMEPPSSTSRHLPLAGE